MNYKKDEVMGFLVNGAWHDPRHSYNPPAVPRPAIDDAQFAYDNQREIEVGILSNPAVLAQVVIDLKHRVEQLERETDDNRKDR